MNIIDALLARWTARPSGALTPEADPRFREIAGVLGEQFAPSPLLVADLEGRLRAVAIASPARPAADSPRAPSRWLVRATVAIVAAAALAITLTWQLGGTSGPTASAEAMRTAYSNLLNADTVRYEVSGESNVGLCATVFNAPLTPEEQESLVADGVASERGIVLTCDAGSTAFTESGVYDFATGKYHATRTNLGDPLGRRTDGSRMPAETVERIFADGRLYLREDGGPWLVGLTTRVFRPFVFERGIEIPDGRLDVLTNQYDLVETLPDEEIDGTRVSHYRAARTLFDGDSTEASEVWIGKDDGLPRRAVIELREPFAVEEHVGGERLRAQLADPESDVHGFAGDPIIIRGPQPDERVVTWTYKFAAFNEPVEIDAPIVED